MDWERARFAATMRARGLEAVDCVYYVAFVPRGTYFSHVRRVVRDATATLGPTSLVVPKGAPTAAPTAQTMLRRRPTTRNGLDQIACE